uniref:Uncharacterized protein n=1 Tax=Coccidioides posadasii RMSCC 3488 TaxID=454284 RepID=A0A0J6F7G9_COCPO|nr:hypothetical protein CPAG_05254 [Coccidioides posadasii RMSCC 3488]
MSSCKHQEWIHMVRGDHPVLEDTGCMCRLVEELPRASQQHLRLIHFLGRGAKDAAIQQLFPQRHREQKGSSKEIVLQLDDPTASENSPLILGAAITRVESWAEIGSASTLPPAVRPMVMIIISETSGPTADILPGGAYAITHASNSTIDPFDFALATRKELETQQDKVDHLSISLKLAMDNRLPYDAISSVVASSGFPQNMNWFVQQQGLDAHFGTHSAPSTLKCSASEIKYVAKNNEKAHAD